MSGIAKKCTCVGYHSPASYVPNEHHILPQSWGGQTVPENLIFICPNTHTATHDLLNQYIHNQGRPSAEVLQHYNKLAQELAARAWAQRPSNHPPYTVAHPGGHHAVQE